MSGSGQALLVSDAMQAHFQMMAHYNRWANERLYNAVVMLPDADYRADRGAFFKSLEGTLNHLVVSDRIWMRRFTGEGPTYTRLDEILHDNLADLREARRAEDARIIAHVDGLAPSDLDGVITFRTIVRPEEISQVRSEALAHFFNHQTHHRGQAHALVTVAAGRDAMPSLDLIIYQRERG